ncbi:MAG TPA: hypothetical protein VM537_34585, partial [Anaerolineae bacterium]|nr:hypothetical protein [Anaerolineae bacterium]
GLNVTPGGWVYSTKPPSGEDSVAVGYFPGEDLTRLIDYVDAFVMQIARVSRTPISYFQVSGHRAAEGTLKQEESGLVARAKDRTISMGNRWEDAMVLARRLWNTYGETEGSEFGALDEEQDIETLWADTETRNELVVMEELKIKRESLKVPLETLWAEAGYSPEDIEQMQNTDEYKTLQAQRAAMVNMARDQGDGQPPGQEGDEEEEGERE